MSHVATTSSSKNLSHVTHTLRPALLIALLLSLAAATPARSAELTEAQTQKLSAAASALHQVQSNLKLAQKSAGRGTAPLKGSKAKLTTLRLDSAKQHVPHVQAALADLPADHADVAPIAAAFAQAQADIATLDARLNNNQAPPTPVAPGTKLDYQEIELLKNAHFTLREVQGNANALTQMTEKLRPIEDPLTIDHRRVQAGINTLANARRKAGFTQDSLDQLPPAGTGVPETVEQLAAANAQLAAAEKTLNPLHQKLQTLIDPANYPQFKTDLEKLRSLSVMYRDPQILQTQRPRAADVLAQGPAAQAEAVRIAQTYHRLMQQQTEQGKHLEGAGNHFLDTYRAFLAAAETQKQSLPQQIRTDFAQADEYADQAVAEQKPLFFTGGIPQVMGFAKEKLALYTALAPEKAPALQAELDQLQASLQQRAQSLEALIIAQNPLPPDAYLGDDRQQLTAVATDAWKHQQENFTVLAVRIPSQAWTRETMWRFSDGVAHFIDLSRLQVQLLVADESDDTLAIIRPINLIKNHQKADTLIGTPMYALDDKLQPTSYLLRNKIK